MDKIFALTAQDTRSAAFFWLGVGIFPVFWSWFTFGRKFEPWQRHLALGWMVTTFVAFALTWPLMSERYNLLLFGLPLLSLLVTLGLCLWLAIRAFSCVDWFFIYIVAGGVAPGQLARLLEQASADGFSYKWAVPPFVLAFLHLLVSFSWEQPPQPEGNAHEKFAP